MAVGKASIKRALNAAVQTEPVQEPALEKNAPEVQEPMAEAKEDRKTVTEKPAAAKKAAAAKKTKKTTGTRRTAAKKPAEVKEQVPANRPVHITEEMPIYLL